MSGKLDLTGQRVAVILTGANIDASTLVEILQAEEH
jgi:hypothetical protein